MHKLQRILKSLLFDYFRSWCFWQDVDEKILAKTLMKDVLVLTQNGDKFVAFYIAEKSIEIENKFDNTDEDYNYCSKGFYRYVQGEYELIEDVILWAKISEVPNDSRTCSTTGRL